MQVQTGLGTGGAIDVSLHGGTGDVVVDVFGYYTDGSGAAGAGYTPRHAEAAARHPQHRSAARGRDGPAGPGHRPGRGAE